MKIKLSQLKVLTSIVVKLVMASNSKMQKKKKVIELWSVFITNVFRNTCFKWANSCIFRKQMLLRIWINKVSPKKKNLLNFYCDLLFKIYSIFADWIPTKSNSWNVSYSLYLDEELGLDSRKIIHVIWYDC